VTWTIAACSKLWPPQEKKRNKKRSMAVIVRAYVTGWRRATAQAQDRVEIRQRGVAAPKPFSSSAQVQDIVAF
jgi:hypothetical protein